MVDFYDTMFPVSTQADMLSLNRSSLYYKPRPSSEWDLQLNRLIDITYTKHPEFGHRRIAAWLDTYYGFHVDRNTVLAPIQKSWLYLVAIIDWYSRYVLSWEIDDTLEISFVLDASKRALEGAHPTIMNSDQGSHFTSPKYTGLFLEAGRKSVWIIVVGLMTTSSLSVSGEV